MSLVGDGWLGSARDPPCYLSDLYSYPAVCSVEGGWENKADARNDAGRVNASGATLVAGARALCTRVLLL